MKATEVDYKAAILSHAAYQTKTNIELLGFTNVDAYVDADTDTEAFICEDKERVYLVFRGTEIHEWKDIKTDLRFRKSKRAAGQAIHSGFYEAWKGIKRKGVVEAVLDRVLMSGWKDRQLVICGHSLGGALAVLAASSLVPDYLITFGQPRVCGKDVIKHLPYIGYHRWVNAGDIVPRLLWWTRYTHGGDVFYISPTKDVLVNPGIDVIINDNWNRFARRFVDHSMERYVEGVWLNSSWRDAK